MIERGKAMGWHTTSDSASGVAHFWTKEKYSRRRSLCGRVSEAKLMQAANQSLSHCARCEKAHASMAGEAPMDKERLVEKLKAGHELYNRGTGWWLSGPKRLTGAADAIQIDDSLMTRLETEGAILIVMLTQSMRAQLPQ